MIPLDPDRTLALSYVPAARRAAVSALWQLDGTFAAVLTTGREPMISRIRLAWWRDALEALDRAPPPAEPVLQALAEHVVANGVRGAELARMEDGWAVLLSPGPLGPEELRDYADGRGGRLFAFTARLLEGAAAVPVEDAGAVWALIDLARHSGNEADAAAAADMARQRLARPQRWPSPLRPIGMLAALAARDAARAGPWEDQGAPPRMLRMLRHRLTGR